MLTELELEELEEDELPMGTFEHGIIGTNISTELRNFVKGKNLGRVADSSAEFRFLQKKPGQKRKPGKQPDASFTRQEKLPQRFRSYPDIAPDLAVEVESPGDESYKTEAKIAEYQKAGVSLVWIIHPFSRTVSVYRLANGLLPQHYGINDALDGAEVLPGFKLAISDIFDYPPDPDPEPEMPLGDA